MLREKGQDGGKENQCDRRLLKAQDVKPKLFAMRRLSLSRETSLRSLEPKSNKNNEGMVLRAWFEHKTENFGSFKIPRMTSQSHILELLHLSSPLSSVLPLE